MGYARANYDDLREQLDALVFPGFVSKVDKSHLSHYPRYLRAMRLRAERLRQDATRDQARMLTVRSYWREYLKLRETNERIDDRSAGRIALDDRRAAGVAVRPGAENRRAGFAQAARQLIDTSTQRANETLRQSRALALAPT
jgi:hypothetical protein